MDKFGIFNLIGSLFKYYTSSYSSDKGIKNGEKATNVFSKKDKNTENPPEKLKAYPPNDTLFTTMKSHDEFVKRVSEKSTANKTKSQG